MKTKVFIVFAIILLSNVLVFHAVHAGDLPEAALTYASDAFIGTVEKMDGTTGTIIISYVLFGNYTSDSIEIQDLVYLQGIRNSGTPKVGDSLAVVVEETASGSNHYKVFETLCAKSDSLDPKILKLKSDSEFIKRMNGYINTGWYSNENRNRILEITKIGKEPQVTSENTVVSTETAKSVENKGAPFNIPFFIILLCCLTVIVGRSKYKRTKRNSEDVKK